MPECTEMACDAVSQEHDIGEGMCSWMLVNDQQIGRNEWVRNCRTYHDLIRSPQFEAKAAALARQWEQLSRELMEAADYLTALDEDNREWVDTEADEALGGYVFWWKWGN